MVSRMFFWQKIAKKPFIINDNISQVLQNNFKLGVRCERKRQNRVKRSFST